MNERDYLKLKRQFTEDFEAKIKALDLIWQEVSGGKKPPKEPQEVAVNPAERGNAAAAVEEFVRQCSSGPFSAKHVEAWIIEVKKQSANRTTIIHKLRRMVNEGTVEMISRGSGKKGSLYVVPSPMVPETPPEPPKKHEPEVPGVEMAGDAEIDELRTVLDNAGTDLGEFKYTMLTRFGVDKARDLTKAQIVDLIGEYSRPVYSGMDIPDDEIPF